MTTDRSTKPAFPGLLPDPQTGASAMIEANRHLVRAGTEAQADGFNRLFRAGQEYFAFVSDRLDRDRALMRDLAAVRGGAELPGIWQAFLQTAQRDYAQAGARIMAACTGGAMPPAE